VCENNRCLNQFIKKFFALNLVYLLLDIIATIPKFLFLMLSLRMITIWMAKIRCLATWYLTNFYTDLLLMINWLVFQTSQWKMQSDPLFCLLMFNCLELLINERTFLGLNAWTDIFIKVSVQIVGLKLRVGTRWA
jgi:hypothetical protein